MGWFDRNRGGQAARDFSGDIGRHLRAAGVDRALDALSGPFGLRRYLVFFCVQGAGVRLTRIDAVPLAKGGGPPRDDPSGTAVGALERALGQLARNMGANLRWDRGAVGVVRDGQGRVGLFPLFDDDADGGDLADLPGPPGEGWVLETPAHRRMTAEWEGRAAALRTRTSAMGKDWEDWEIEEGTRLVLHVGSEVRCLRCAVLATYEPARAEFVWQADKPLFPEPVFALKTLPADWDAAMELGSLGAARLDARWLFAQPLDDDRRWLLVAVFD